MCRTSIRVFLGLTLGLGSLLAVAQEINDVRAVDLATLQQRATAGDVAADMELSDRYNTGRGVPIDGLQALRWMRDAAEKGNVKAEAKLGDMLRGFSRAPRDYKEAVVWLRKAAEQGDSNAQTSLAAMLSGGDGVCMDFAAAASWLRKAAEQGVWQAMESLGNAYELGQGVPRDLAEARKWYQKSADLGAISKTGISRYKLALLDSRDSTAADMDGIPTAPTEDAGNTCIVSNMTLHDLARSGDKAAEQELARNPNRMEMPTFRKAQLGDPNAAESVGDYYESLKEYDQAVAWYTLSSRRRGAGSSSADFALVRIAVLRYRPNDPADSAELAFDSAPALTAMNSTSQEDFRTVSAGRVLSLLQDAASIKVNPAGTRFPSKDRRAGEWFKGCNGTHSSDDTVQQDQGENACFQVFTNYGRDALGDPANLANMQYIMSALVRGCGLYAPSTDKAFEGRTCGVLGAVLYGIGNASAAKAVWDLAPGCYSQDERAGTPMNGCVRAMTGRDSNLLSDLSLKPYLDLIGVFKLQPRRLARLMWRSCTSIHDRESCEFLASDGASVDMAAVAAVENERHEGIQEFRARNAAELDRARAASEERRNSILSALQAMGGSNPNAILDAGNQQAAAIRALGDANAKSASQLVQARLSSQPATAGAAIVTRAEPQPLVAPSPFTPSGATPSNAKEVSPLPGACVSRFWNPNNYNWLALQNDCGQPIYVEFIFNQNVGWAMTGAASIAVGAHLDTGRSSGDINLAGGYSLYVCPDGSIPVDLNGRALQTNVSEFRCRTQ